ncbi:MAG: thioredoxin family protein [Clostridia bacterium]|nr:thioredoxin family protein [Clostridia bacterium]
MLNSLTSFDFERRIDSSVYSAVLFFAEHCGPSRAHYRIFRELAEEIPCVDFFTVSVDNEEELAERYNIDVMPSVMLLKRGRIISVIRGVVGKRILVEKIYDICK